MRRILVPAIVALWGLAALVYRFAGSSASHTGGAYHGGQNAAAVFGVVMLVAGATYLVRALRERR